MHRELNRRPNVYNYFKVFKFRRFEHVSGNNFYLAVLLLYACSEKLFIGFQSEVLDYHWIQRV